MATAYSTSSKTGKKVDYNVSSNPEVTARNRARAESMGGSSARSSAQPQQQAAAAVAPSRGAALPMQVPTQPVTPSASAMQGVAPYQIPPTPAYSPAQSSLYAASQGAIAMPPPPAPAATPRQSALDSIYSLIGQQGTKAQRSEEIYDDLKVDKKQRSLTKLENQYMARQRELELQKRSLIETPYGGTKAGQRRDLNTLERETQQELADIAIQKAVALNDYSTAYEIAERKVAAEFEPIQQQIDALTKFYQLNQDDLTTSEKIQLEASIREQQAQADFARDQAQVRQRAAIIGTASTGAVSGGKAGGSGESDPTILAWAGLLREGKAKVENVPQAIRNRVILAADGAVNVKLSDTAIKEINQTNAALDSLNVLESRVRENTEFLGPISGLQALNPWSKSRQIQADVNRIRQTVGKALEGGVLRKEDEEKYKTILATLLDTPETAIYKIEALRGDLTRAIEDYKSQQAGSGRYVPESGSGAAKPDDLRAKYNY
jgi:hypothetical protein